MSRLISKELDDAFAPPGEKWVSVSPQLRKMRRSLLAAGAVLMVAAFIVIGVAAKISLIAWVGGLFAAAIGVIAWGAIGRNFRSWGYSERAEDLLVTRGVLFRRLVVVPYGRMQLVDVTANPFERKFGIATVRLHTAAAGTDARICGLSSDEAARLRDRLTVLGEARSAGL
ncbi:MAG: PH domain-containing protein [Acidothermaceae bacterium]